MKHSMTTRGKSKKRTEDTDEEEMEMIEEMIEEDAQEDQPENPTQPEPEIEVIVGNQPDKPTQSMATHFQEMMRIMVEQLNRNQEKTYENFKKPVSYTHLDVYKRQEMMFLWSQKKR